MYQVSAQSIDEHMINVHYYYYFDREQSTNTGEKFPWSECQLHYHFHYLPIISSEARGKDMFRICDCRNAVQFFFIVFF